MVTNVKSVPALGTRPSCKTKVGKPRSIHEPFRAEPSVTGKLVAMAATASLHNGLANSRGQRMYRYMGFGSVKTAWMMAHKIRLALVEENTDKLGGIVEVDETWTGGKNANKHVDKKVHGRGGKGLGKTPIIGAVQRKGNVVARVLDHVTS
jgi:hypothetical protein